MKIVFSSNIAWSIYAFRSSLLKELQQNGHEIYCVAKNDKYSKQLTQLGFTFYPIDINNNSKNPINDLFLVKNYIKVYKKIKPDIILHNAIKPNIYGTIAAGILKIPSINNISGLGTLFIKKSLATTIAKFLYKFSQKKATTVFFQNKYDQELFIKENLVQANKTRLIPGSGVNTQIFHPKKNTNSNNKAFEFLFIARLIKDKGLIEYLEAAKILKNKYKEKIVCSILGPFYQANETAITPEELEVWVKNGIVNYLGETDEVVQEIAHADSIVLPSYREGLSKVLIEASAMAKPIVTTNVPGCKDVVLDNYNGFLCQAKNSSDLANKMEKMFLLNKEEVNKMGENARKRALDIFDERKIIAIYTKEINQIIQI
jgi:glycosyltransferase involved in cell wall biosynthesis